MQAVAFIADVNTRTGKVTITPPVSALGGVSVRTSRAGALVTSREAPELSIVAGDVVELTASNYSASNVGDFTPGKIRVAFDVQVTNRLSGVELILPSFPVPPTATDGVILFPFETVVTTTTGGVGVNGDGTDVIVEQPNRGLVSPSVEFDGAPFNFFNDGGCGPGSNDCYRYETFGQPLGAGATSEPRRVGFDIDPAVGNFRARLIVAGDARSAEGLPAGRPLVWRNAWSVASAPAGQAIHLDLLLDMRARPALDLFSVQGRVPFNSTILRFDSAGRGDLSNIVTNPNFAPGLVRWLGFTTEPPIRGNLTMIRLFFTTLPGAPGNVSISQSILEEVTSAVPVTDLLPVIRVVEDTFTLAAGGPANQPPRAMISSHAGSLLLPGSPVTFSPTGSLDPDGSIVSYFWTFGDGGTSVLASPVHTYQTDGLFTATVTVTDNLGATGFAQILMFVGFGSPPASSRLYSLEREGMP